MPKIISFGKTSSEDLNENPLKRIWASFLSLDLFTKLLIITLVIALPIGIYYQGNRNPNLASQAATPDQLEAEGGVLSGNATIVSDTSASGGKSVMFSVIQATLTPTKTPTQTITPTQNPVPTTPQTQTTIVGFGKNTIGGQGQPIYHVTNLSDSGAGSLRDALSQGNRRIVFDVGGTINLNSQLYVGGSFITLDGFSAPSPGITLTGHTLYMQNNIHDIILQGFRHRGGWQGGQDADGITMARGVYNIVLDHISVSNFYDEAIDLWDNVHDVTIQNSILAQGGDSGHNYLSLVGTFSKRITYYHNLFYKAEYRQPAVGHDPNDSSSPSEITADVINNVIWDYTAYGTTVYHNGWANVVGNYYYSSSQNGSNTAIQIETGGKAYSSGNYSKNGVSLSGNQSSPFSVPSYAAITQTSACTGANDVKANAGTKPLDAKDQSIINSLDITCN